MCHFFLFLCITVSLGACKKHTPAAVIPPGMYQGTFSRFYGVYSPATSKVSIRFFASFTFKGQSDSSHYPDICHGDYSLAADSLNFENTCIYTANFDWSYILSHKYKILLVDDSLFITRSYDGIIYTYDSYKLKKQR